MVVVTAYSQIVASVWMLSVDVISIFSGCILFESNSDTFFHFFIFFSDFSFYKALWRFSSYLAAPRMALSFDKLAPLWNTSECSIDDSVSGGSEVKDP